MSGVATAIAGSALVGAVASNNASKRAEKSAQSTSDAQIQATERAVQQARGDVMEYFPSAQQSAQQGFQQALNVFNQTLPQQTQAFTSGNVAAQNALLAGLPSMQAAILGTPMPELNLQPFQYTPDLSFADQTLASIQDQDRVANEQSSASLLTGINPYMQANNPGLLGGLQSLNNFQVPNFNINKV